ncbi:MAG: metallophosphoesterase [Thermoleophilia bacterium]|nr:metallophosphoesterase [Thermoleophilia bacterium]
MSRAAVGTVAGAAVAGIAAVAYGAMVERNRFTVRYEVVPVLDPGARSITVLHLSDLHMAPWQHFKQEWVRSLAALEPDLVVSTGDNLGHERGLEGVREALDSFRGVPGVFVHGSNDYFAPAAKNPLLYLAGPSRGARREPDLDTPALDRYLVDELGWLELNNLARAIEMRGSRIELFGVNDAHIKLDRLDRLTSAIDDMRENVGWQDDRTGPEAVTIGVTHSPYQRVLNSFVTHGADIIFAGHTHGGQVRIPGQPALVTNCDVPREKAQGLSVWHHASQAAYLNVSAGLGTSIYAPVRFSCPPEAVVVTLTAGDIGYS